MRFLMAEELRAIRILDALRNEYPNSGRTILHFRSPLELLIATVLSAQCTDEKVNEVTGVLFKKYKTAEDFAEADENDLRRIIRPTGFYIVKSRRVKEICQTLVKEYDSRVPRSMKDLLTLKGVARKTANIVLTNAYGVVEGIAVDTHVMRLSKRLALSVKKDRDKIEQDLMKLIPKERWSEVNSLLVEHGRRVCKGRKPFCIDCVIRELCPSAEVFLKEGRNGEIP